RESSEPWNVNVSTRYRSETKEWRSGANIGFNAGRWSSSTSTQHSKSETIRLTDVFDTESKIHDIYGGETFSVRERLTFRAADNIRLTARGGFYRRTSDRHNYTDRYTDYNGGLRGLWDIDDSQDLEVTYSYDQYDKARFTGGERTHDHDYSNRQHIVHLLYNKRWEANTLTVGGDALHDFLTTYQFTDNAEHRQTSADIFVQFDYNPLRWLNLVASLRDDYFSASRNNALTARIATMFKLTGLSVRASYAGGFRAPSLKEMYMNFDMAGIQMIYGNPDLKPERSHNFNLSLEHYGEIGSTIFRGKYSATASGYYNYYDRRITTTDFPGDAEREEGAVYANEDGVRVSGLDVTARYRALCGFGLSASYNFLHVGGRRFDSQFSQPRPHSATWRVDFQHAVGRHYDFYLGLSGRYLSKPESRYETDGAYTIWKLTLQQRVWKGININFAIDNLFAYVPKVYYWNSAPTTGRTWTLGLSLDIDRMFK
ncbi:MAG: TonB-dependent receptor, partial [Muribaculaceae bacterium]|nr:TonB-dependent receptor [Muribaculaceae bacterium]